MPREALAPLPAGVDKVGAATVALSAVTARQGVEKLGPAEGRTLLVTGAAGAVGGYALRLAADAGW